MVQVEAEELVLGCEEGLYEPIDWDAVGGKDQFIDAAVDDCGVGTIVWSTAIAYDGDKITDEPADRAGPISGTPRSIPGKRGLRRGPKYTLEFALMADGVPPAEVYDVLRTEEGVDRAFAKLDEIKDDIIWWEAGAQPPQLLGSGEVIMTSAYNGRISAANQEEGRNFKVVWPGSIYAVDSWVILANSPNKEAGLRVHRLREPARAPEQPAEVDRLRRHPQGRRGADRHRRSSRTCRPRRRTSRSRSSSTPSSGSRTSSRLTERFTAWAAQ